MADIGTIVPAATRVEPSDVLVGNVVEHGGDTRDIPITALRRSNANHDIESINNSVRLVTGGVVGAQLAQNGDFSVHGSDIFTKKSNGFTGLKTTNPDNLLTLNNGGIGIIQGTITQSSGINRTYLESNASGAFTIYVQGPDGGTRGTFNLIASTSNGAGDNQNRIHVALNGNVGLNETDPKYKLDVNGSFGFTPGSSVTPIDDGDVVIEATNNTTLTFKLKGSDSVVRTGTMALA